MANETGAERALYPNPDAFSHRCCCTATMFLVLVGIWNGPGYVNSISKFCLEGLVLTGCNRSQMVVSTWVLSVHTRCENGTMQNVQATAQRCIHTYRVLDSQAGSDYWNKGRIQRTRSKAKSSAFKAPSSSSFSAQRGPSLVSLAPAPRSQRSLLEAGAGY